MEITQRTDDYEAPARWTDEYTQYKAAQHACSVRFGTDTELMIDVDDCSVEHTVKRLEMQQLLIDLGLLSYSKKEVLSSKSGNQHVIYTLHDPLDTVQRILLQTLLGSDPKREALSLAGYFKRQENPILLFRPLSDPDETPDAARNHDDGR